MERILRPLLALPTVRVFGHPQTQSVLVQLGSEVDAHDVYCICARCGSERSGRREWVAFQLEVLQEWPTFSYVSVGSFVPSRQHRAEAKAQRRAKRKSRVCAVQDAQQVLVVPHPMQVDSSAEYVPPGHVPEGDGSAQRLSPMRSMKLHRRIVVDAEDSFEPLGDPRSDIEDSPSGSDSGSESDSGSGSGSGSDAWDGDATGSAITVNNFDLEAAAPAPPPQKKFRRTAPRCAQRLSQRPALVVVDVHAATSSAPVTHLLSEGDFFPTDTEAALKQETKP